MYETMSPKGVRRKGADFLSNFENEWNCKTEVKRTTYKPSVLVNKVVSHGGIG